MKTITYVFFSVFIFCNLALNAQCEICIDGVSFNYYNGITKHSQTIDNYRITNNSNEEYLTWIALTPNKGKTNVELVHDFFKKR